MRILKTINGSPFPFYVYAIPNKLKVRVRKFHGDELIECEITEDLKWIILPPGKFIVDNVEVFKLKINKSLKSDILLYNNIEEEIPQKNPIEPSNESFNYDELRHLAVNFAITCLKGYEGSFDDWYKKTNPVWREIANRKK